MWPVRAIALLGLVFTGSTLLVRLAPGYLSDAREMDSRYASVARAELAQEAVRSNSLRHLLSDELEGWKTGTFGVSRQFGVPVLELIRPTLAVSGELLFRSLGLGWALALVASFAATTTRNSLAVWQAPTTILLAIPASAFATLCLLINVGGPVAVMALLLAARDFKLVHRTLRKAWLGPSLLYARAQGLKTHRLMIAHVLPAASSQIAALAGISIVTALSALVPVEVIFDVPGLGKLAWNAALNRDLPVLLAVTVIMALAVSISGCVPANRTGLERA